MQRIFARALTLMTALLICACLLSRPALADETPQPAATSQPAAAAGTEASGESSLTGTYVACIAGAITGLAIVMLRRKGGSSGKSYMPVKKKK